MCLYTHVLWHWLSHQPGQVSFGWTRQPRDLGLTTELFQHFGAGHLDWCLVPIHFIIYLFHVQASSFDPCFQICFFQDLCDWWWWALAAIASHDVVPLGSLCGTKKICCRLWLYPHCLSKPSLQLTYMCSLAPFSFFRVFSSTKVALVGISSLVPAFVVNLYNGRLTDPTGCLKVCFFHRPYDPWWSLAVCFWLPSGRDVLAQAREWAQSSQVSLRFRSQVPLMRLWGWRIPKCHEG